MNRKLLAAVFSLTLLSCACSQTENATKQGANTQANQAQANQAASSNSNDAETTPKSPPADVVRVDVVPVELKAGGGSTNALIKLTVAQGYHINANPPSFPYLKATELNVGLAPGIFVDKPIYPAAVKRQFAFSKEGPLAVYEGEVTIKLPLRAAGGVEGKPTLTGKLRIQACDEEACYPPRILDVAVPVTVK